MEHKAGDKMFIDYAGDKLHIVDKDTGEIQAQNYLQLYLDAAS
ncbi:MAG: hypothetical protein U0V74_04310 [Chitinophagales bacterium]